MTLSQRDQYQLLGPAELRRSGDHLRVARWGNTRQYVSWLLQEDVISIVGEDLDEIGMIFRESSPADTLVFGSLDGLSAYIAGKDRALRTLLAGARHRKTPTIEQWRSTLTRADIDLDTKIRLLRILNRDEPIARAAITTARERLKGRRVVLEHANSDRFIDHLAPFLLANAQARSIVVLGKSRLGERLGAPLIERPYVKRDELLDFIRQDSEREVPITRLAALCEEVEGRRSQSSDRGLTGRGVINLSRSLLQRIGDSLDLDIPGQLASPLLVSVREGELDIDRESSTLAELAMESDALLREITELCADVQASAYLSNCAPGVERKLARLRGYLEAGFGDCLDAGQLVQIGVVGASLKEVVRREQESLPDYAVAECAALFTQLDMFLVQFEPWRKYLQQGALVDWGREGNETLARALAQTLMVTTESFDGVTEAVRARTGELTTITLADDVTQEEVRGAATVAHNIFSVVVGYTRRVVKKLALKIGDKLMVDTAADAVVRLAKRLFETGEKLAKLLPELFSWVPGAIAYLRQFF
jgi:hypothetical protein